MNSSKQKIRSINSKLLEYYGKPNQPTEMSGIDYLIETILSQNTNDKNRDKAFQNFKEKYGSDWEAVVNTDTEELTNTIRVAGLAPTKAERIKRALKRVKESQGEYSIEFLKDMPVEEGKKWLTNIPGIGPKTAAVILCFHFDKPVMPVDTHVHRVSKRLDLVPESASREKSHKILEEKVPNDIKYEFHRLLIEHGREHCKARNPTCSEGPLGETCAPKKDQ